MSTRAARATGRDGSLRAAWRIALFLGAAVVAGLLITGVAYPIATFTGVAAIAREWGIALDQWATVAALMAGTWAALRADSAANTAAWQRVDLDAAAASPRRLAIGAAVGLLGILVPCALLLAAGRLRIVEALGQASWWRAALLATMTLLPGAFAEELLVRGYLLTVLRDAWGVAAAVLFTSALFAALHVFNPGPTVASTVAVALAGILLATVRLTTRSLLAAGVAHLAWNLAQAVVLHAPVSGLVLPETSYRTVDLGPAWLTGGAWGPEGGAAAAAAMLVATFLLVRYAGGSLAVRASRPADAPPGTTSGGVAHE